MNKQISKEFLQVVLLDVLQKAASVALELDDSPPPWSGEVWHAELSFLAPGDGNLWLATTEAVARDFAAHLLNLDADDDALYQKAPDALGEMLNIIAGQLLTRLYGEKTTYDLGAPQVVQFPAEEYERRLATAQLLVSARTAHPHRVDLAADFWEI